MHFKVTLMSIIERLKKIQSKLNKTFELICVYMVLMIALSIVFIVIGFGIAQAITAAIFTAVWFKCLI